MCAQYHDTWLKYNDTETLMLDGNIDFENDDKIVDEWIDQIIVLHHHQESRECSLCLDQP